METEEALRKVPEDDFIAGPLNYVTAEFWKVRPPRASVSFTLGRANAASLGIVLREYVKRHD